jgi:hypothetical protein
MAEENIHVMITGYFNGLGVSVNDEESINRLYFREGFFGKGNLSRSEPCYSVRMRETHRPQSNNKNKNNNNSSSKTSRNEFHAKAITLREINKFKNLKETLHLNFVECFYLVDVKKILQIYDQDEERFYSVLDCWNVFLRLQVRYFFI